MIIMSSPAVVVFKQCTYAIQTKLAVRNLSLSVHSENFLIILGENGAGKTSLLKLVMGFTKPSRGEVLLFGMIPSDDAFELRKTIAFLSEATLPPKRWTVGEFLDFNAWFYAFYDRALEKNLLDLFCLSRSHKIGQLSTGLRRRVQLVGGLSFRPKLIVIDELTAALDIVGRAKLMRILSDLRKEGTTILLATNLTEDLSEHCTHVLVLKQGAQLFYGTRQEFLFGNENPSSKIIELLDTPSREAA